MTDMPCIFNDIMNPTTRNGMPILDFSPGGFSFHGCWVTAVTPGQWRTIDRQEEPFALNIAHTTVRSGDLARLRAHPFLRSIDISYCPNIPGRIVDILCDMPRLSAAHLAGCNASPKQIARLATLPDLCALSIGESFLFNERAMSILARFPALKALKLDSFNRLKRHGLDFLADLPNLEHLCLSNCANLTAEAFAKIGLLKNLRSLRIEFCPQIDDDCLAFLDRIDSLESLVFYRNDRECRSKVTNRALAPLARHRRLETLLLDDFTPCITASGIESLAGLTELARLDLSGTGADDDATRYIAGLPRLKALAPGSGIHGESLAELARLPELESLDLWNCTKMDQDAMAALGGLTGLRHLRVPYRLQTGKTASFLARLTSLEEFQLEASCDESPITDDDLAQVAPLVGLKYLAVASAHCLTDDGLTVLRNLTRLESLHLCVYQSGLTVAGLRKIPSFPHLKSLCPGIPPELQTDEYAAELARFPKLEETRFHENGNLTDKGVACLKNMSALKAVTLYKCPNITVEAVAALSGLPNLTRLNLAGNRQLGNECAGPLAKMSRLETLDLTGTRVSHRRIRSLRRSLPESRIDTYSWQPAILTTLVLTLAALTVFFTYLANREPGVLLLPPMIALIWFYCFLPGSLYDRLGERWPLFSKTGKESGTMGCSAVILGLVALFLGVGCFLSIARPGLPFGQALRQFVFYAAFCPALGMVVTIVVLMIVSMRNRGTADGE